MILHDMKGYTRILQNITQEALRANLSLWTQVLLDDGHTVPDWSESNGPTDGHAVLVRRDICPKDGELYFPEAPGADRVEKCRACGHPRYVQSGPLAGKPTAYCFLFDLHLIFARWFGTPGLSSLFNPYHGDTRRGCIAGADGDLVPDECQAPSPDLNGDGLVNAADLALLLNGWGACAGCVGDLNRDGTVGAADLAIMLNAWS
jgi:hypothetical protein